MKHDLLLYQRALFLRKKKGYSYNEIREEVPVSKSTLSLWLREVELTNKQKARIKQKRHYQMRLGGRWISLAEWNRHRRQREIMKIRAEAKNSIVPMDSSQLFAAGILLYWAEGNKAGNEVRLSNSDQAFIRFVMRWFRECLEIPDERLRASIHFHEGQDEYKIRKYWSRITHIPLRHFYKSFCKPPGTGHRTNVLEHGTVQIRVRRSADLLHSIIAWREALIEDIISGTNS